MSLRRKPIIKNCINRPAVRPAYWNVLELGCEAFKCIHQSSHQTHFSGQPVGLVRIYIVRSSLVEKSKQKTIPSKAISFIWWPSTPQYPPISTKNPVGPSHPIMHCVAVQCLPLFAYKQNGIINFMHTLILLMRLLLARPRTTNSHLMHAHFTILLWVFTSWWWPMIGLYAITFSLFVSY